MNDRTVDNLQGDQVRKLTTSAVLANHVVFCGEIRTLIGVLLIHLPLNADAITRGAKDACLLVYYCTSKYQAPGTPVCVCLLTSRRYESHLLCDVYEVAPVEMFFALGCESWAPARAPACNARC